ncbi:class I adenylate-forming enzyme family protein [Haliangium sp.]|uniref:class I adenylate-forming enzyme family protein n=1 Tax=Haliangium sp. TaxID=2663208 RepID=UPI003D1015F5
MTRYVHAIPLLHDFLIRSAQRLPDKVALVCGEQRLTYAEIAGRAYALAHALKARGVARGDRVIVYSDNTVEAAVAFWGVLAANAVVSMVNPQTKADKLAYLLRDCRPTALIAHAPLYRHFAEPVRDAPSLKAVIVTGPIAAEPLATLPGGVTWDDALADMSRDQPPERTAIDVDLASIIYTSGSTGDPKGVMHTHLSMRTAATSVSSYLENREDDVILGILPLSFDYGLYQMIMAFREGARLVLERSFVYPARVLEAVARERVTVFPGVPTIYAIMNELKNLDEYDFSSVRYVSNTAAALTLKHIEALRRIFPAARVVSMYGLTECKRVSYLPPEDLDKKPLSVGVAIPNTEVWIEGEDGRRLGPDQVGELVVRGSTVMRGYWEKPEATAKKLRPGPLPHEVVLHTGDYCKLDQDGYLYFVGRMDDIIKSRGEKVAPREVENAITDLDGVKEVAVIGVPDPVLGQAVKAYVVLEQGAHLSAREIQIACQRRLENYMVPKEVVFVPDLPKTSTGKIKKTGLEALDAQPTTQPTGQPTE